MKSNNAKSPQLYSYTQVGFLINEIIDARPDAHLPFREIYDAARDGQFVRRLSSLFKPF